MFVTVVEGASHPLDEKFELLGIGARNSGWLWAGLFAFRWSRVGEFIVKMIGVSDGEDFRVTDIMVLLQCLFGDTLRGDFQDRGEEVVPRGIFVDRGRSGIHHGGLVCQNLMRLVCVVGMGLLLLLVGRDFASTLVGGWYLSSTLGEAARPSLGAYHTLV